MKTEVKKQTLHHLQLLQRTVLDFFLPLEPLKPLEPLDPLEPFYMQWELPSWQKTLQLLPLLLPLLLLLLPLL